MLTGVVVDWLDLFHAALIVCWVFLPILLSAVLPFLFRIPIVLLRASGFLPGYVTGGDEGCFDLPKGVSAAAFFSSLSGGGGFTRFITSCDGF